MGPRFPTFDLDQCASVPRRIDLGKNRGGPEGGRRDVRCARCKLTSGPAAATSGSPRGSAKVGSAGPGIAACRGSPAHVAAGDAIAISGYLGGGGQFDDATGISRWLTQIIESATMPHLTRAAVRKGGSTAYQERVTSARRCCNHS